MTKSVTVKIISLYVMIIILSSCKSSEKSGGGSEPEASPIQPNLIHPIPTPTQDVSFEYDVLTNQNIYNIEMLLETSIPGAYDLTWTPDGRYLAVSSGEPNPRVTFFSRGSLLVKTAFPTPPQGPIAISKSGKLLGIPSNDKNIYIWEIQNGSQTQVLEGHQSAIISIAFSPLEDSLASISNDGNLRLWYLSTGKTYQTKTMEPVITDVAYMPAGKTVAVAELSKFTEHFWNSDTLDEQKVLNWSEPHPSSLTQTFFALGDKTITWVAENIVQLMTVSTGELGPSFIQENDVQDASISPDGKILAVATSGIINGDLSNYIQFWDIIFEAPLSAVNLNEKALSVKFSPDGRLLAVVTANGRIQLLGISLK